MTKFQSVTVVAFILGFLLFIVGIVVAFREADVETVKAILYPATALLLGSTLISAINPIKK